MSEELVVLNNTALATPAADNGNWGDDDAIVPVYLAIKQALTEGADHLMNGTLFQKETGQVWDNNTIEMIILDMYKTNSWKPSAPKFVKDERPLCRSNNRINPLVGFGLIPQDGGLGCAKCPKKSWERDGVKYNKETGEGPKPLCEQGFTILFLDRQTELPYIYTASGQSVTPAEAMYSAMKSQAKLVKAKTGKMPNTFDFAVSMTTEKGNKAFKIKFTQIAKLTAEVAAKFGPLYTQFVTSRTPATTVPAEGETTVYEDASEDTGAVLDGSDEAPAAI